jgi:hypothetical protein
MAAELIQKQPAAIQLRYLQTLLDIGVEKNTTVVFPVPIDILTPLSKLVETLAEREAARIEGSPKPPAPAQSA